MQRVLDHDPLHGGCYYVPLGAAMSGTWDDLDREQWRNILNGEYGAAMRKMDREAFLSAIDRIERLQKAVNMLVDPVVTYHAILPAVEGHRRCFRPDNGTAFCSCNKWWYDNRRGITDHPFTPRYPGVDEWKQLCIYVGDDGEVCGRSEPIHKHNLEWHEHAAQQIAYRLTSPERIAKL